METELVSIRLEKDEIDAINQRAEEEKTDKTTAFKRTLATGTKQYKLENAFKKYGEGKIGLGKAAQLAEISLWEAMEEAKVRNIPNPLTKEELGKGLANLEKILE